MTIPHLSWDAKMRLFDLTGQKLADPDSPEWADRELQRVGLLDRGKVTDEGHRVADIYLSERRAR